ncbi:MAG: flagellar M-ring protein FliF [Clostridia bacterium]|nr:flagellar M-ring protein FliF [Clostridia bacterium]
MKASSLTESLGLVGNVFGKIRDWWKARDPKKRRLIIVLGIVILVVSFFSVWLLNITTYGVLYTNLSASEAGQILAQLEEMGVDAKADGSDTVLIPEDSIDSVRMELAAAGLPKNERNLDILDKGTGFGVTEDDKAVYRRYQLQQDLQNAIKTFDSIQDAVVSLTLPEKSVFLIEDQATAATAAVLLTIRSGEELSAGNVQAIAKLVLNSVPDLTEEHISIIDSNMNVLSADTGSAETLAGDRQKLEQDVSRRLQNQVLNLLQPVFGVGKVLAEVNVALDFDESTVESIRFEPAEGSSEGIVASIDSLREIAYGDKAAEGIPGTAENGSSVTYESDSEDGDATYEKNSEQIVYEINTIKESLVKAKGTIKSMSVSVLLDSRDVAAADYTENVRNLVSSAIGVSAETITVETLPFNGAEQMDNTWDEYNQVTQKMAQWERTQFLLKLGAGILVAVFALILLLRVLRGKNRDAREILEPLPADAAGQALRAIKAGALSQAIETLAPAVPRMEADAEKQALEQYIESNPELVANILRTWLAEETR